MPSLVLLTKYTASSGGPSGDDTDIDHLGNDKRDRPSSQISPSRLTRTRNPQPLAYDAVSDENSTAECASARPPSIACPSQVGSAGFARDGSLPPPASSRWTECKNPLHVVFQAGMSSSQGSIRPVTTLATPTRHRRHSPPRRPTSSTARTPVASLKQESWFYLRSLVLLREYLCHLRYPGSPGNQRSLRIYTHTPLTRDLALFEGPVSGWAGLHRGVGSSLLETAARST